jgi:EmrB/QacA subfamily drug resistance transporter
MSQQSPAATSAADPRRWKALAFLGLIQFMLILDVTVVNVALPDIKTDLGFTQAGLQWVVSGYVLMAGGLLLLGGRLADVFGRKRLFLIGVGIFAVASVTCGLAANPEMLVISRFVQGVGEALAAPASMGLIAVMFPDPLERMKALGIWGGIAGLGGTSGTVISGVLVVVPRLVSESRMQQGSQRPDYLGAFVGTAGLIGVVDGLVNAAHHSWGSSSVLLPLLGGLALIALMLVIEARSEAPLIPLSFFKNRTRVVSNFTTLFFSSSFFTYFFLLTLYQQQILDWSPLKSGLSYLPFGLSIGAGIGIATAVMPRIGVKPVLATGFFGVALGLFLTSTIGVDTGYASHILPGMIVLGLSSGISFPAFGNASLHEVTGQDSSLASGVQNAMQQIGGALGLATLVTLASRHAVGQMKDGVNALQASVDGSQLAFHVGVGMCVIGGILVIALLEHVIAEPRNPLAEELADA